MPETKDRATQLGEEIDLLSNAAREGLVALRESVRTQHPDLFPKHEGVLLASILSAAAFDAGREISVTPDDLFKFLQKELSESVHRHLRYGYCSGRREKSDD